MKLLLVVALALLGTAYAVDVAEDVVADVAEDVVADVAEDVVADVAEDVVPDVAEDDGEHEYMYFPDGDGVDQLIDLKSAGDGEAEFERNVNTITFNLFTRNNRNNAQGLVLNNANSVWNSHFWNGRPTRIVTHGWRSSQHSESCTSVRNAFLNAGDYNVIVVDWSNIAGGIYGTSANAVPSVGNHVAAFINFLRNTAGLNLGTTWVIGHSLGGHVAGIAAFRASGTVAAVVALDPALPGFDNAGSGAGVTRNDAAHVQVIHTNGGSLGLMRRAGNSDFYPNGGAHQPGCGLDVSGACAHSRAYLYFAESILNVRGFRANFYTNLFMGGRVLTTLDDRFELWTRDRAPFALG